MNHRTGFTRGGIKGWVLIHLSHRVARKERRQVGFGPNRSHTGSAATVGNTEGLVKVEMRNISPDVAIAGETHERVQVGAIDIDLTTSLMDSIRDVLDPRFIHSVGRGIGDHQGRKLIAVLGNLGTHIINVDVASVVTRHDHHFHSRQHSACGVGAVGAGRNQADIAVIITAGAVIPPNGQEPGIFTLTPCIGLERN